MASTTESPPAASAANGGGRAFALGPRRAARLGAAVLVLVALSVLVGVLLRRHSGGSAGSRAPRATIAARSPWSYGGLPSWLPKAKVPVGQTMQATRAHPALSIQGETVSVVLGGRRVLATAVGPSVPQEGQSPVPKTSPCTFIVTFAHASHVIPLTASAFTLIDHLGRVRQPRVSAMDGGVQPRQVMPGRTVSLRVRDVLPTGDGALTWAPYGGQPLVSWDFSVEID